MNEEFGEKEKKKTFYQHKKFIIENWLNISRKGFPCCLRRLIIFQKEKIEFCG